MNRREFLKGAAGTALFASTAAGWQRFAGRQDDVDEYDFLLCRVAHESLRPVKAPWNVRPDGDYFFIRELGRVIRCKVKIPSGCGAYYPILGRPDQFNGVVDLSDYEALRRYPFLFMTSEGDFRLSSQKMDNLGRYLREGGFILMDDCVYDEDNHPGDYFFQSSRKTLDEIFGAGSVQPIPLSHEVFHNIFDFSRMGLPYLGWGKPYGAHGLILDGRLAAFLSPHDMHCGWGDPLGHDFGVKARRGNRPGYEDMLQMGINIAVYALSH